MSNMKRLATELNEAAYLAATLNDIHVDEIEDIVLSTPHEVLGNDAPQCVGCVGNCTRCEFSIL